MHEAGRSGPLKIGALLAAVALSLMAVACIKLLPDAPPPPRIYAMDAGEIVRAGARGAAIVAVARPTGREILMGEEIVWRKDGTFAVMEGAAWPGRTPDMLQGLLAETITRRGELAAGVRSSAGVRPDMEIRWDLIAFEVVEEGGRLDARFAASVNIVRARTRELLASEIVDVSEPLATRTGSSAADALARAARRGSARIADLAAEAARIAPPQPRAASTRR
jgi:ABC-type uncharacterized transport system auxiliary subunit